MTDSPKPRPYPTPTRLKLMRRIAEGARDPRLAVKHWHFVKPQTRDTVTDDLVTARVRELVAAKLADLGQPDDVLTSIVRLTCAGTEYLNTYGKSE